MMIHNKQEILDNLSSWNTSSFRLRMNYVGAVLDPDKLGKCSFKNIETHNGYSRWIYQWNNSSKMFSIILAPFNSICQINLYDYLDWQFDDSVGAAEIKGWYYVADCSNKIEKRLSLLIDSCLTKQVTKESDLAFSETISKLLITDKELIKYDPPFIICSYINQIGNVNFPLSRLLTCTLIRHIEKIQNPLPIQDLPLICGSLGLLSESILAIRTVLSNNGELSPSVWCNMGAVLCDDLGNSEAAIYCFLMAIKIDPHHHEANQNLWIAGRDLLKKYMVSGDFILAIEAADQILSIGKVALAHHGFFSYYGFALELNKQITEANKAYKIGLEIDKNCDALNEGFKRTKNGGDNDILGLKLYKFISSAAYDNMIRADKYPWT